ncbi:MAG: transposase [Betaproteobacteria bacterium]
MSLKSRKEYLQIARQRYAKAKSRTEKSHLLDEVVQVLGYHRKYAVQILKGSSHALLRTVSKRTRPKLYLEALPIIQLVWEALDFPCAERLQPVLLETAELLAAHGELLLTPLVREQLGQISRATLARRLRSWTSPKPRRTFLRRPSPSVLEASIPIATYRWNEDRPGALAADLVEHNGGQSLGQFACTLTLLDVVTGYSRRRAVLGKGRAPILRELQRLIAQWPYSVWGLHSDNGPEFLNGHLLVFAQANDLEFTRSRPYRKNDNPHAEQKNLQYVRQIVGYARYDTPQQVEWLNQVYACLDRYANLFLPMRKLTAKERLGSRTRKAYDTAQSPVRRILRLVDLTPEQRHHLETQLATENPLALHRQLEALLLQVPNEAASSNKATSLMA